MGRKISRAESWATVYKAFQNVNFSAYDFNTIKRSLVDYIKLYHSENFNDYIENSEVVAQIEVFAYVAEILAYRQDMNAHENFFGLAERKDSILQLAKFISYNASRNLPARGLVKITSVQTTQDSSDSKGNSLANKKISWNDTNNSDWKEQFFIIMNLVLEQQYGSVSPNDRVQIDDVLFELYRLKNRPLNNGVFSYSASGNGETYPMELVPVSLDQNGPYERRPEKTTPFSLLYGADGLGDGSDTTGFFCFTKQGTLNKIRKQYDGITPNQTTELNVENINDTDVWVNNIDPDTGNTFKTEIIDPLGRRLGSSGEWVQVDIANVENVIFNTNLNRNKFEIETLDNDKVRLIFGDGEFADIPSGMFEIWYRTSTAGSSVILQNSVINKTASFTYLDHQQKVQTLTFTFSLTNSLVNGAPSEDVERIRRFAPSVFYTQDRMVNGRDYNSYPLQDQSIAKLRTVNRTFAGDSKYSAWHDPSEHYEDVKIFGDDLTLMYDTSLISNDVVGAQPLTMIRETIQPLLARVDVYLTHTMAGLPTPNREFTQTEIGHLDIKSTRTILGEIQNGLDRTSGDFKLFMCYRPVYSRDAQPIRYEWTTFNEQDVVKYPSIEKEATFILNLIRAESKWQIWFRSTQSTVHSPTTSFWFNNGANKTLVQDTLTAKLDNIVVLAANINSSGQLLGQNHKLNVIGTVHAPWLPDTGQTVENTLSVIPPDLNDDGVPDNMNLAEIACSVSAPVFLPITNAFPREVVVPVNEPNVICGLNELIVDINGRRFHSTTAIADGSIVTSDSLYAFEEMKNETTPAATGDVVKFIRITLNPLQVTSDSDSEAELQYNLFIRRGTEYKITITRVTHSYFTSSVDPEADPEALPQRGEGDAGLVEVPRDLVWTIPTLADLEMVKRAYLGSDPTDQHNVRNLDKQFVKRYIGRNALNFAWFHVTPRYHLVDPSPTNIMDMFVVTRAYYEQVRRWLRGETLKPKEPTSLQLRSSYEQLLESRMISDSVIVHSGKFKILFGSEAMPQLRASFKLIKASSGRFTDNELKVRIVDVIRNFFDINQWEFGEPFYGTELIAAIHASLPGEIDSIVIVPEAREHLFGELFEIIPQEDELFQPAIDVSNIIIVDHYNSKTLKQR